MHIFFQPQDIKENAAGPETDSIFQSQFMELGIVGFRVSL